jgi:hypothetical protein
MNSGIDKSYNVNALTSHLNSTQLREIMKFGNRRVQTCVRDSRNDLLPFHSRAPPLHLL